MVLVLPKIASATFGNRIYKLGKMYENRYIFWTKFDNYYYSPKIIRGFG